MGIDLSKTNEKFKRCLPYVDNVRRVHTQAPQPVGEEALVSGHEGAKGREGSVAIRITFISMRRRLLDPDALPISTKYLQDAVCESLGIDDGDPRIAFEYLQLKTIKQTGVMVKIDL